MDIRVRDLRMIGKGNLKAVADVEVGPFSVRGLRIVENGRGPFVAWPEERWLTKDGQTRYTPIVEPTREAHETVQRAVLAAYAEKAGKPAA